jgi:acyl-coenzyme A thioesterase PaaI-like protein
MKDLAPNDGDGYLLDQALALRGESGLFEGHTHAAWANMVGPYGGITAALMVQAVVQSQCLGEPVSLTINYAAALKDGPYRIRARAARTNRATQHWVLELTQHLDGADAVMATATVVTAARREVWRRQDLALPPVAAPETFAPVILFEAVEWVRRYEIRLIEGAVPAVYDDRERDSQTRMWLRDAQQRGLDLQAIACMSDAFYPRIWLRRARWVPTGTVSLSVYFHASGQELAEAGAQYVYAQARAQDFRHGFFDQTAHLWSRQGLLLASAHQIVYYKE